MLEALAEEWNLLLAHPFRWEFDGKDLQDKAVKRFTAMLRSSAATMDIRIMTKQLLLMTNLLQDYFSQVSGERWHQLVATMSAQSDAITALIEQEGGPRRKKNAQQALDALTATLQHHSISLTKVAA